MKKRLGIWLLSIVALFSTVFATFNLVKPSSNPVEVAAATTVDVTEEVTMTWKETGADGSNRMRFTIEFGGRSVLPADGTGEYYANDHWDTNGMDWMSYIYINGQSAYDITKKNAEDKSAGGGFYGNEAPLSYGGWFAPISVCIQNRNRLEVKIMNAYTSYEGLEVTLKKGISWTNINGETLITTKDVCFKYENGAFTQIEAPATEIDVTEKVTMKWRDGNDGLDIFLDNKVTLPADGSGEYYVNDHRTTNGMNWMEYIYVNGRSVQDIITDNETGVTNFVGQSAPMSNGGQFAPITVQVRSSKITVKIMSEYVDYEGIEITLKSGIAWKTTENEILKVTKDVTYKYYSHCGFAKPVDVTNSVTMTWKAGEEVSSDYDRVRFTIEFGGKTMIPANGKAYYANDNWSTYGMDWMSYIYINGQSAYDITKKNAEDKNAGGGLYGKDFPLSEGGWYAPISVYVDQTKVEVKVLKEYTAYEGLEVTLKGGIVWANADGEVLLMNEDITYRYMSAEGFVESEATDVIDVTNEIQMKMIENGAQSTLNRSVFEISLGGRNLLPEDGTGSYYANDNWSVNGMDWMSYIHINGQSLYQITRQNAVSEQYVGEDYPFKMGGWYAPVSVYIKAHKIEVKVMNEFAAAEGLEVTLKAGISWANTQGQTLKTTEDVTCIYTSANGFQQATAATQIDVTSAVTMQWVDSSGVGRAWAKISFGGRNILPADGTGTYFVNDHRTTNGVNLLEYIYINGRSAHSIAEENNNTKAYTGEDFPMTLGGWHAPVSIYVDETVLSVKVMNSFTPYEGLTITLKEGLSWATAEGKILNVTEDVTYQYSNGVFAKQSNDVRFRLTYLNADGSTYQTEELAIGEEINLPDVPAKVGYVGEWKTATGGNAPATMPSGNLTLQAVYTVTLEVTKIEFRTSGNEYWFFIGFNETDYTTANENKDVSWIADTNILDKITLYYTTGSATLREAWNGSQISTYRWSSANTIAFRLKADYVSANGVGAVVESGIQIPMNSGDVITLNETRTFWSNNLAESNAVKNYVVGDAQTTETTISLVHLRSGQFLIGLGVNDWSEEGASFRPAAVKGEDGTNAHANAYWHKIYLASFTSKVKLHVKETDTWVTLGSILTGEVHFNIWSVNGTIAFKLDTAYNGATIDMILFEEGCEFPTYYFTGNANAPRTVYVLTEAYLFESEDMSDAEWAVDWTRMAAVYFNGGNVVGVGYGEAVAYPENLTPVTEDEDFYYVTNWFLNGELYDFASPVNGNLNLTSDGTTTAVAKPPRVTLMDGDKTVSSERAEKITLPELAPVVSENALTKVFIGWTTDAEGTADLYPAGYTYAVEEDVTFYAVWIGFAMQDGAAVRLTADGETSGLRFLVDIDSASYNEWNGSLIAGIGTFIVPTEYLGGVEFVHSTFPAGYYSDVPVQKWNTAEGDVWTYTAALTKISVSQYARSMSARGYLLINYTSGQDYVYTPYTEELNARNIYQVATKAYKDTEKNYSSNKVILGYVNAVADLTIAEDLTVTKNVESVGDYAIVDVAVSGQTFSVTFDKEVKTVVLNGVRVVVGYTKYITIGEKRYSVSGVTVNGTVVGFTLGA